MTCHAIRADNCHGHGPCTDGRTYERTHVRISNSKSSSYSSSTNCHPNPVDNS